MVNLICTENIWIYLEINKFHSLEDAIQSLGSEEKIINLFVGFQKYLYK
jgi:hypothetical protein